MSKAVNYTMRQHLRLMIGPLLVLILLLNAAICGAQPKHGNNKAYIQEVVLLRNKAMEYAKNGDTENALRFQNLALEEAQTKHLPEQQAITLKDIALLLKNNDSGKSLMHLQSALHIAHTIKHSKLEADIYHAISEVYALQQNYKAALIALQSHNMLVDSLIAKENTRENKTLKQINQERLQRGIGITIAVSILIIFCLFYLYFRNIRILNKKLRSTILAKDKLFSILGHDLRGPAGSMMQALSLFGRNVFTEEEEKYMVQSLTRQSKSLYEAIETLFQWSNSQLNGVVINLQQFDSMPIIYKNIELLTGQAELKQITITPKVATDAIINADPNHFDYIIRNLLSNAIKFSHKGGHITIRSEIKQTKAIFYITDEGIGMTPEIQKQFETGNMESTFGTAGEKGIGLGLSLTKEFIKANKGTLRLNTTPDVGTTISFSMPLH